MARWGDYYGWRPYVPVAQRRAKAQRHAEKLAKKGRKLQPVEITGRAIATTFWGKAWCDNLESYSDFENRLPRGRTYARNGSIVDLQIASGRVRAIVSGSEIYQVRVDITPLSAALWKKIKADCGQSIDSLIDLLQGRFSRGVMARLTRKQDGLFPKPNEIKMSCSCPDWAGLCKHLAAVLYGVGARLDSSPELLFLLREVDHLELIGQAVDRANLDAALSGSQGDALASEGLGEIFGIDLEGSSAPAAGAASIPSETKARRPRRKAAAAENEPVRVIGPIRVKVARPASTKSPKKTAAATKPVKVGAKRSGKVSIAVKPLGKKPKASPRRKK